MPEFEWKRQYNLGISAIDTQHQVIMDRFNSLYDAIAKGESKEVIVLLIEDLMNYSQLHFHDEEELFQKTSYPKIDEQIRAHEYFRSRANAFHDAYLKDSMIDPLRIVQFLKDWIENHLMSLDMDYKEFMERVEALRKIAGQ
jgi:hemerythrin-like metal-binding protein